MSSPTRIFISYRREDCMVHAGRLAENLQHRVGAEVFLDIESIPPGVNFPDYIAREIAACDVVLVMIGDDWLSIADHDGTRRIADTRDWVHIEVAAALGRGVLTIPVLVEGARIPRPDELPEPIANLALRNAVELRDSSWSLDFERLARALPKPGEREAPAPPSSGIKWPARFTDNWFATHVRSMDDGMLRALRAELYRRSWSDDEIAVRVLVHAHESARDGQSESPTVAEPQRTDPDGPADGPTAPFPSRFTDSWFAASVPQMDAATIAELVVELRNRAWSDDDLGARVFPHATVDLPTTTVGLGPDAKWGTPGLKRRLSAGMSTRTTP